MRTQRAVHGQLPAVKNPLPKGVPQTIEVTLKQGSYQGAVQFTAQYDVPVDETAPQNSGPFAGLSKLSSPRKITVKVVVNEKEWSGPLGEGEIWVVKPRTYLAANQIMFADALYRAANSPVTTKEMWFHPMLLDIYERRSWDIYPVGTGGLLHVGTWSWQERRDGHRMQRYRAFNPAQTDGGLTAIRSEGGWLYLTVNFSKEEPTDTDAYNRRYWDEEFAVPLCECTAGWTRKDQYGKDNFNDWGYDPTIYAADRRAFNIPLLLQRSYRGVAGPFDASRIGVGLKTELDLLRNDELLGKLLPGTLLRVFDRGVAEEVQASDPHFLGVVASVHRLQGGEWEVRFKDNTLWFEQKDHRRFKKWRKLGQPHRDEESYHPNTWVLPSWQKSFIGFKALRFRTLRLPEFQHEGGGLVPQYEAVRNNAGEVCGFKGRLDLYAEIPGDDLLPAPGDDASKKYGSSRPSTWITVYDPRHYDDSHTCPTPDLPEPLSRWFHGY